MSLDLGLRGNFFSEIRTRILSRASRHATRRERSYLARNSHIFSAEVFKRAIVSLFKWTLRETGTFFRSLRTGIFFVSDLIFSETAARISLNYEA